VKGEVPKLCERGGEKKKGTGWVQRIPLLYGKKGEQEIFGRGGGGNKGGGKKSKGKAGRRELVSREFSHHPGVYHKEGGGKRPDAFHMILKGEKKGGALESLPPARSEEKGEGKA